MMTALLREKEESLRKLKETLRKTQQEGEESCQFTVFDVLLRQSALALAPAGRLTGRAVVSNSVLQGEDLHARLTNPRGLLIKSSISLEKSKLEEEVTQLRLKTTQLDR